MGIKGLFKVLRPVTTDVHISKFKQQRIAVDASCWLHRSSFTCPMDIMLGNRNLSWLKWCMSMVHMLVSNEIVPTIVFDGCQLPQKQEENTRRKEARSVAKSKAVQLLKQGKKPEAFIAVQQAISISPEMQLEFIKALRQNNIDFIVAPYEADAQLAFLFKNQLVDAVISEDSDLLLFGVSRLISKLTKEGQGRLTDMSLLSSAPAQESPFTRDLSKLPHEKFISICIMSGCDYLPGLAGIGLKTALKMFLQYKSIDRILKSYQKAVPDKYLEKFKESLLTFLHQRVFDRTSGTLCHLSGRTDLEDHDFFGKDLSPSLAVRIAQGEINTKTLEPVFLGSCSPLPPQDVNRDRSDFSLSIATNAPCAQKVSFKGDSLRISLQKDFLPDVAILKGMFSKPTALRPQPIQNVDPFDDGEDFIDAEFEGLSDQLPDMLTDDQVRALLSDKENELPSTAPCGGVQIDIASSQTPRDRAVSDNVTDTVISDHVTAPPSVKNQRLPKGSSWKAPLKKAKLSRNQPITAFFKKKTV
uniref:Exonuclease 1 n=2 Tax=Spongospora subterranea TaxID=70186 RepID=A0A0H5QK20_9EUKA|eukprot:CRZ02460.1 hypothetical protein [Spongospora subterranea]